MTANYDHIDYNDGQYYLSISHIVVIELTVVCLYLVVL